MASLPWLSRDVVRLIRDKVARLDDCATLLAARLVSKEWKDARAVMVHANPVTWCPHFNQDLAWTTAFSWPVVLERGRYPFDLPPLLLELLLLNRNEHFRQQLTWAELVELAQRMVVQKKARSVEQLEREAWLRLCATISADAAQVEEHVVMSILLSGAGTVDWLCAGVQTLLFTPAFQKPVLALLKGAQRHWFPLEYSSAELGLELLKMGVWCNCENVAPPPRGLVVIKRRRREDANELWFNKPNAAMDKWRSFSMHKAWRDFIGLQLHRNEQVLETIRRVGDPELLQRIDECYSIWQL